MEAMNPSAPSSRELAAEKLRARAGRLRAIRRRVWLAALATFALAFGVIGVSGSMGTQTTTVAQTGGSPSLSDDATVTTSPGETTGTSSDQGSSAAPMTTRQS